MENNLEVLYKQDKLIDFKNETLMEQLRKLQSIQSSIINKDRIIDQMNDNIEQNNSMINFLIIVFILSFVLFFTIISNGYGQISSNFLRNIFIIIIILILLCYLYFLNIFHIKDGVNFIKYHRNELINNTLKEWDNEIYNQIYDAEDNKEWEDDNCDCPQEEEYNQYKTFDMPGLPDKKPTKGYFYFDGKDPKQQLVPTPIPSYIDGVNDVIDWVDYSHNSKHYYDFPNDHKQNRLNESTTFANYQTYSSNF